jgi:hypothetical protein
MSSSSNIEAGNVMSTVSKFSSTSIELLLVSLFGGSAFSELPPQETRDKHKTVIIRKLSAFFNLSSLNYKDYPY